MAGSLLLAPVPLHALFLFDPGGPVFFAAVVLGGALLHAIPPLLVVSAQEFAPGRQSAASGMITGLTTGLAALLYVGVGRLQEALGLAEAMRWTFLGTVPAAGLALLALRRAPSVRATPCSCAPCACSGVGPGGCLPAAA